jgi:hypothetical protein
VLTHTDDAETLATAIRVMARVIDQENEFKFGPYDSSELDTYARLLQKNGQTAEALCWQRKAVDYCAARDPEVVEALRLMEAAIK